MATLLPVPPPPLLLRRRSSPPPRQIKPPNKKSSPRFRCVSPLQAPTSTGVSEEESSLPSPAEGLIPAAAAEGAEKLPLRGCKTCGREEIERGCNGEGRIQGGIATVPGFGWWPIKAYRPCPGFVASGGRYRRQGQSMDEVAFGRGERETPVGTIDNAESSKKEDRPKENERVKSLTRPCIR